MMLTACHSTWISEELFFRSGKKYEDLKEKQVLVFFSETMRGKSIFVAVPNG